MGTIKIELPVQTEAAYKIKSKKKGETFLREFEILIKKYDSAKNESKPAAEKLSGNLQAARDYLGTLKDKTESREASRLADELRKGWTRNYD